MSDEPTETANRTGLYIDALGDGVIQLSFCFQGANHAVLTGIPKRQARAIANCETALANIAKYEAEAEKRAASRPIEITFIDRERLKIAAEKAPTQEARDAARRMLDRSPPRMTESEKKKFKL